MGGFISWIQNSLAEQPDKGQDTKSSSISGMISTLVPVLVLSAVYLLIFLVFRRKEKRFHAPRSYLGSMHHHQRSPVLPDGFLNWIPAFWKIPDSYALTHQSLDAYLFIRYLKIATAIAFGSLVITWPILFPVNATGGGGASGLDVLAYGNVNISEKPNYLYAQVFVGWAVYGFVMYMITREMIFYINLRQTFLLSPFYSNRLSSRVVLFTNVPKDYINEQKIHAMYPGLIRNVWIAGDSKELTESVEERDKVIAKLEGAQVKLIKLANKARNKELKKNASAETQEQPEAAADAESASASARWVPEKKRPTHRLGFLGLFGKKVDTINWGREELEKQIPAVETAQAEFVSGKYNKIGAIFVEFNTPADAENAFQTVTHHVALHMCPKVIGVRPEEVIWGNLGIPWWQKILRRYAVIGFIIALIVFWAIPVAIVGLISQVKVIAGLPGMNWINSIPPVILGVVSGLLPSVAMSILMSLVPVVMRALGKLSGLSTLSEVELFTQNAYFAFQVIQVFLVQTLFSSATNAIISISASPGISVFDLLAKSLPTSSNFYISYFIVQGLTISVGVLTQVVGQFIFRILYKYLAGTPRSMYTKWTTLSAILWGSLLPVYTNIVVISITYSVIAPLMLFWSTIGLGLFYLAYRYNLLFVSDTAVDTRGLIYPRALKQLYTGIYLGEICMVGLFAVSKATGPAVLMAVFLIFTILFHLTINKIFNPLLYGISRSLAAEETAFRERGANAAAIDEKQVGTNGANNGTNGHDADGANGTNGHDANGASASNGKAVALPSVSAPASRIARFFKPWQYADYHHLRQLVPADAGEEYQYDQKIESEAYWAPAATKPADTIWLPEDKAGVSKQEIAHTSSIINTTDEGCTLDEKNKIVWDEEGARPPIYTEKIMY